MEKEMGKRPTMNESRGAVSKHKANIFTGACSCCTWVAVPLLIVLWLFPSSSVLLVLWPWPADKRKWWLLLPKTTSLWNRAEVKCSLLKQIEKGHTWHNLHRCGVDRAKKDDSHHSRTIAYLYLLFLIRHYCEIVPSLRKYLVRVAAGWSLKLWTMNSYMKLSPSKDEDSCIATYRRFQESYHGSNQSSVS